MLIRIVRLTFAPDEADTFLSLFKKSAPRIRTFEGCQHLELWQDTRYPNIFTTCSHWENNDALQRYRRSPLFKATWKQTKPLFAAPPRAHSYERREGLNP